jgi:serine/threonine-protein kinase
MNDDAASSTDEARAGACDESEVARVFDAYLADLEAGRPVDPARLLADHPDIAEQLRACLDVMQLADQMASGSGTVPAEPRTASHSPEAGASAMVGLLTSLGLGSDEMPQVLLRELPDEREPLLKPRSAAMPPNGPSVGRFQLQGEIARGGMGAVLKGRDIDLGRDLAIKVLLESQRDNPDIVRRFVEEAQIGGQLQHPGVVPVYELGTFPDRRPYFAMKLVKGRTLAALLQERTDPAQDLPRFLSIFEQVCQTVAYAHARGVIHRDLKPSNVMVGSFGEVQVMDWGLAKVLPQGGVADEGESQRVHETVIMTVRSGSSGSGSESQAGSVLGTPAYMAPEQARGEVDRIDERGDVFGLGAILCEILTGWPPFAGSTREEIRAQAARGDVAGALGRLDASGADAELIGLARACLAAERGKRARRAGEVAQRISAYQAGVQERLRQAELARVEAQTRAAEERKRRRVTVALAGSLLVMTTLGGLLFTNFLYQRQARAAAVDRLLGRAATLLEQARGEPDDIARWQKVLGAIQQLEEQPSGVTGEARAGLAQIKADAATGLRTAERDATLRQALIAIRANQEDAGPEATDAAFAEAFRAGELDIDALDAADAANRLRRRPTAVVVELAGFLDYWSHVRRRARRPPAAYRKPLDVARAADSDEYRNRLRGMLAAADLKFVAARVKALAEEPKSAELPAPTAVLLAAVLQALREQNAAVALLRQTVARHPDDLWVNFGLAEMLEGVTPAQSEEAVRYYTAARALHPQTGHALGHLLDGIGRGDEAIATLRDLATRWPDSSNLACFGKCLKSHAHRAEAVGVLARAVAAAREAIRLKPDYAQAFFELGFALHAQDKFAEAEAEFRAGLKLKADDAVGHCYLGTQLGRQGKLLEAIGEWREAIRLHPDYAEAHFNLGNAMLKLGRYAEAEAACREAIRLQPGYAEALSSLGNAIRIQGRLAEAEAACREAIRLKPDLAGARGHLGLVLRSRGQFAGAIAELRKACELASTDPVLVEQIERALAATERQASLVSRLPGVLSGERKPADRAELPGFAQVCYDTKRYEASARLWAEAFQAQPKLGDDMQIQNRYNAACAAALAGCVQGKDETPLDEASKARWRKQAVDWLEADLAVWSKLVQGGPPQARQSIAQTLQHWTIDPDLAGLREPAALAKLSHDEQNACRSLWAEVDALLAKARNGQAQPSRPSADDLPAEVFAS